MNVAIELVIIGQQQIDLTNLRIENAALQEKIKALMPKSETEEVKHDLAD